MPIEELTPIAYPNFKEWIRNLEYKGAAQDVASMLREARSRAIGTNLGHRVEFIVGAEPDQYRMTRGNRAYNSTDSSWDSNVVISWVDLPLIVDLKANADCSVATGTVSIKFNPNGTGSSRYVCIMDKEGNTRYRVGVPSSTTGRVLVQKE